MTVRDQSEIERDALPVRAFSNSTEWEIWAYGWCHKPCAKDANEDCPLLTVAVLGKTPAEWTKVGLGDYRCSEFEEAEQPEMPPVPVLDDEPDPLRRPDGEFVGQVDIFQALLGVGLAERASPGGLLSTGGVQTAVSGTGGPPEPTEATGDTSTMLEQMRRLLTDLSETSARRPVAKLVCGTQVLEWLAGQATHPEGVAESMLGGVAVAELLGVPVDLDRQATPGDWAFVNVYGITVRRGHLDALT